MQNAYAVFEDNEDNDDELNYDVATVTTHLVAMTMQSQLTAASTSAILLLFRCPIPIFSLH